jgi:hypothetical protein
MMLLGRRQYLQVDRGSILLPAMAAQAGACAHRPNAVFAVKLRCSYGFPPVCFFGHGRNRPVAGIVLSMLGVRFCFLAMDKALRLRAGWSHMAAKAGSAPPDRAASSIPGAEKE